MKYIIFLISTLFLLAYNVAISSEIVDVHIKFNKSNNFTAEKIEKEFARFLEVKLSELNNVEHVYSESSKNRLKISIQYKDDAKYREGENKRKVMSLIEGNLDISTDKIDFIDYETNKTDGENVNNILYELLLKIFIQLIIPLVLIILIVVLLVRYLNINKIKNDNIDLIKEIEYINEKLSEVKQRTISISDEDKTSLFTKLEASLKESTIKELLNLSKIKKNNEIETIINLKFNSIIDRLKDEMMSLSKRANLNLSIGIVTASVGVLLLGTALIDLKPHNINSAVTLDAFSISFLPRLTLVILIEIFSYFFLKLYKSNLSEIKYFHNEITTMESRQLAVFLSTNSDDKSSFLESLKILLNSERNFILNEGQSTIDIETSKVDIQSTDNILEKISSILNRKS